MTTHTFEPSLRPKKTFLSFLPLYMIIFLDVAGIVLVLPVLTPLILQIDSTIVPKNTSLFVRDFLYGFSLAIFPFFMFFSTPILGDLSDKFGRKKILIYCLVTSALGYLIAAIGIIIHSLWIVLASRILVGLAAGTQSIAVAAIVDLSTPDQKTKNLAWVVFASSIGLILGPIAGGLTADKNILHWFGFDTPFFVATFVCLFNAALLMVLFKELKRPAPSVPHTIQLTKGFRLFLVAFTQTKFCLLSIVYFGYMLAWSLYYQTITWVFMQKFHYSVGRLGLFVAYIGVIFAVFSSLVVRLVLNLFKSEIHLFIFFALTMAIANFGAALGHSEWSQWAWAILNAGSEIICFTLLLSIFSNLVGLESQGWIMGVTNALCAMTWTVGGLIAGPLGFMHLQLPLWIAGGLCLLSFVVMIIYQKIYYK